MEAGNSDTLKELKMTAKWSIDNNEKKKAILQMQRYGEQARPAIEEVLGVTAYNDVRQACLSAISSLGREQKNKHPAKNRMAPRKRITAKAKKSKKKTKR